MVWFVLQELSISWEGICIMQSGCSRNFTIFIGTSLNWVWQLWYYYNIREIRVHLLSRCEVGFVELIELPYLFAFNRRKGLHCDCNCFFVQLNSIIVARLDVVERIRLAPARAVQMCWWSISAACKSVDNHRRGGTLQQQVWYNKIIIVLIWFY